MTVFCKNCRWFYRYKEQEVSVGFTKPEKKRDNNRLKKPFPPSLVIVSESGLGIRMCQHPDCFRTDKITDIVWGEKKEKIRIAGQGQFNANLDCSRYKRKWWKFWIIR